MATRIVLAGAVVALVVLSLCSAAPVPAAAKNDPKQVEQAHRDYLEAVTKRDEKALRRLLADDFTQADGSGNLLDREKAIKQSLVPVHSWKADVKEVKVRVYGDAAILTCVERITINQKEGVDDIVEVPLRVTVTLVRKGGAWVLAAEHMSMIPEQ